MLTARRAPVHTASSTKYAGGGGGQVENHFQAVLYPHRLNFYDHPPRFDVTLDQFETFALDRLRILSEIESSFVRNRPYEELKTHTATQCKKYLPLNANSAVNVDKEAERRKDHVGHFVLRLAFCRTEELRRRFVKAELALFRIRYEGDDRGEREVFMQSRGFDWVECPSSEKREYETQLRACLHPSQHKTFDQEKYYKVHWTRVPDLVEKRRVFLKAGTAYVPSRDLSSVVYQDFQARLERALEETAKALPRLDEDRLTPILDHLSRGFLAGVSSSEYTTAEDGEGVTANMIDDLSRRHFPLCMRSLHNTLRKNHHLKHQGRLQYGLFLKIVGLPLNEALAFWKKSFQGHTALDKFDKEYAYNIKHSYGKVGGMKNYAARSCQTILTTNAPGPSESHGCPYRHYSEDNLKLALQTTMGIENPADIQEILQSVRGQHYHIACTRVYEITHGMKKGEAESVTHPNEYTKRSRDAEKAVLEKVAPVGDAMAVD